MRAFVRNDQPVASVFESACPHCAIGWVDRAVLTTGLQLDSAVRRQLIAGLLARRHLILSGPRGIGKRRLAKALSLELAHDRLDHVFFLQGHPWWAAGTGDVTHFVELQTEFSLWRLNDFVDSLSTERQKQPGLYTEAQESPHVVCVERMSPAEVDLYFGGAVQWLFRQQVRGAMPASLRFVGTFDSDRPPALDAMIERVAAVVHLSSTTPKPTESELRQQDLGELTKARRVEGLSP